MDKDTKNIIIVSSLIAGTLILGFVLRQRGRLYLSSFTRDLKKWNEEKIKTLDPKIRDNARKFLQIAENDGVKLRISEGKRSVEDQLKYYNEGTSQVTFGYHNTGLALDVYPVKKDGWTYDMSYPDYDKIKKAGIKAGFETIGEWDKPHYQKTFGYELSELKTMYNNKDFDKNGFLKI
jgi:peptidoglycan LD-endopeptidase CwlK